MVHLNKDHENGSVICQRVRRSPQIAAKGVEQPMGHPRQADLNVSLELELLEAKAITGEVRKQAARQSYLQKRSSFLNSSDPITCKFCTEQAHNMAQVRRAKSLSN
jgi:hypothetical protein